MEEKWEMGREEQLGESGGSEKSGGGERKKWKLKEKRAGKKLINIEGKEMVLGRDADVPQGPKPKGRQPRADNNWIVELGWPDASAATRRAG